MTHCIENTTTNPNLNVPCTANQSFIIAYLDYTNDANDYPWNTKFNDLSMVQIVEIASNCKTTHPDINAIRTSADQILGKKITA